MALDQKEIAQISAFERFLFLINLLFYSFWNERRL